MSKREQVRLSKTISHALRHAPWLYELEPDEEGWVSIESLLNGLRNHRRQWASLSRKDLEQVVQNSDKGRFEISNDRIRALYGHSTPQKLKKTPAEPPAILYHGTTDKVVERILADGLQPMSRQYVHLSLDTDMAEQVGSRKSGKLVILAVDAAQAHQDNITFYRGNELVWLADFIPAKYLRIIGSHED